VYARTSARIPVAEGGWVRALELGEALERVRVAGRAGRRFLKPRLRHGDRRTGQRDRDPFFALWKDADPDVPILKEAKAEYVKL
jgi:hypothetical protein